MSTRELIGQTALVTGGAGFIGSHIVQSLVPENDVRVLDDLSAGDRSTVPKEADLVIGDVRDRELVNWAMRGVDIVFHQAALVSVDRSIQDPRTSQSINAGGTLEVLEAARDVGARVVLASSAAVYGHPASVPTAESSPKAPTSPYGVDKLTADRYARLYTDLYGLPTVALRYFNVYGPGHSGGDYSGVIEIFTDQACSDRDLTVHGDGTQTRDFVHVSDVVRANRLAATTDQVGDAFNVGTGRSVSVRRLAELIRDGTGSSSEIVHTDPRTGDIDRSRADVSKSAEALGFEAEVGVDEGIRTLVNRSGPRQTG